MKVDINLLKKLRQETNAPLKDCKEALIEAEWDIEKAKQILKKKWALKAAKKADRETNEGIVKVKEFDDGNIVWVKLACETDFVAKNELFHKLAEELINVIKSYNKEVASLSEIDDKFFNENIKPLIDEYIGKIWENIRLLDAFVRKWNAYVYSHPWNKIVSIVFYEGNDENIAKEVALQVAAMNPKYISVEDIPSDVIEELKQKYREELKDSWKPEDIIDRIIEGKLKKDFSEEVLLEQPYIRDETKKVKDVVWNKITIKEIKRFAI